MSGGSKAKRSGTAFEVSLLPLIRAYQQDAIRAPLMGKCDIGDFYLPRERRYVIEAKNHTRMALPEWMKQAEAEAKNAGVPIPVVVSKRYGKTDPSLQWCHMTFGHFLKLAYEL